MCLIINKMYNPYYSEKKAKLSIVAQKEFVEKSYVIIY